MSGQFQSACLFCIKECLISHKFRSILFQSHFRLLTFRSHPLFSSALPQVTVSPSSPITLPEGTSQTTLQCTVSGNPPVNNVYWLLNGTLLNTQASPGKYAGSSTTVPSLTILNVNRDDAGQYVCAATNSIGATNSQSLELVVTCEF